MKGDARSFDYSSYRETGVGSGRALWVKQHPSLEGSIRSGSGRVFVGSRFRLLWRVGRRWVERVSFDVGLCMGNGGSSHESE